ncbi:MAG: peptidylprolyl isomerase [Polyangiales bacterium]
MPRLVALAIALVALMGCTCNRSATPPPETPTVPAAAKAKPQPAQVSAAQRGAEGEDMPDSAPVSPALLDPSQATDKAPDTYTVKLDTTAGEVLIDVTRSWSPKGADRFYNLVKLGYYDGSHIFRVISGFMAQMGLSPHPKVNAVWSEANIGDDPVTQSNTRAMVSFATRGPNTRTTQFFINFGNNAGLDGQGFSPFGKVRDMKTVDAFYADYGEGAPAGNGPSQGRIHRDGGAYLDKDFPKLDKIKKATIVDPA